MVLKDSLHAMKDMDVSGSAERLSDFGDCSLPLPGPPHPPAELLTQRQNSHNHRMFRQGSPPTSRPVLVARGTACQSTCTFPQAQRQSCTSKQMASGSSRRGRGSPCMLTSRSCDIVSSQNRSNTDMLERILEKPKLAVVEEPKDRGMRFRYECEGRSAGSILGVSSTETNKTQPTIEIQGSIDHIKRVTVTVSLVTKDLPHRPHPHCLVGKDCPDGSGICVVSFNPHTSRRHSFANLGIQCVRRRELDFSLQKRRNQNIDPFQTGHTKGIEDMDMNAVRLCFQCELEWEDGRKDSLGPVVSSPIYDKKATTTSQLKITCLNLYRGPCTGKTEIYMLCDKVQKDDIEILFRKGSWKANGEFAQTDVHRQIAIVFKTPPYQDQDITDEVDVNVILRRISDQMESDPVTFTYLAQNPDPYEVKRKTRIKSDVSFREKSCMAGGHLSVTQSVSQSAAAVVPAAEQPFHFPQPQPILSPDERLCAAAHSESSAPIEMLYPEPLDSGSVSLSDDAAIINHLLEIPGFLDMLVDQEYSMSSGYEQGPDDNFNINQNVNQNFSENFSNYNDWQFNMLVNENQTSQSEPQENASSAVQVKTEETL
ncbi:putative transcription factor p65 homolog isoform X2 [Anabas testudineus]|uniref:putative transcription factor p65 homolog isoform X2 n=1 Tax=Anabas testudineus TaxID=64144 RepID=UPI000E45B22C|nr:putative transcription factor p65 homolog isoform X2 [Anabas testudineus]